jgi:uroporphyrinogen-III synthase
MGSSDLRRIWVTRARPGAEMTAARLTTLGFTPLVAPLLAIQPLEVTLDLTGVQALAFTSLNGVAAFAALTPDRSRPVLTVGDATARAASEAGFTHVRSADGDLIALAALIRATAPGLSILHACAAEPAGDLASAVGAAAHVRTLPVYGAQETGTAPPEAWDAVLIHSPRAARALPRGMAGGIAVAISPAAAAPLAALDFAEVRVAAAPTEAALLAALGNPGSGV